MPEKDIDRLQRVQNYLASAVTKAPRFSRSVPILKRFVPILSSFAFIIKYAQLLSEP